MDLLAFIVIVLVASTLQAATGFGFAIMAIPFFLLLFEPYDAIQLNIILSLIICITMVYKIRHDIDKGMLFRLTLGSLIGVFPGLMMLTFFNEQTLKIFVSIILLISVGLLISQVKLKQSIFKEIIVGAVSGLLTSSIGMGGPPLMIYFLGAKTDKATLHATTIAYFIFVSAVSFLLQFWKYSISSNVWVLTLWAIPVLLIGMLIGQWIFARLDQQLFRKIIYILLIASSLYMLFTS
ncbi:MAG: sulfite exporter TauE/SafE family protein [Syntrophomonadaceae bacterium]|nr:sulfite exporter TauE/SafE family protein [Syntrophomonadaceae bacterium]